MPRVATEYDYHARKIRVRPLDTPGVNATWWVQFPVGLRYAEGLIYDVDRLIPVARPGHVPFYRVEGSIRPVGFPAACAPPRARTRPKGDAPPGRILSL